jgi:stage III sporulation protein AG
MKQGLEKQITQFVKKYKYVFIVLAAGLALMLLSNLGRAEDPQAPREDPIEFSLEEYQSRLETVLSGVDGVGNVKVMLTLKSGSESVYAKDTRESSRKTDSSQDVDLESSVVTVNGSGQTEPVVRMQVYPLFQGALVICDGADSPSVRYNVTEAVAALTGITSQNICILKTKS